MTIRSAEATWNGTLKEGKGKMSLGSGAWEGPYSFYSRFEDQPGSNPEELLGAANAGCFSMFLSALLTDAGFTPRSITTSALVHLGAGPTITQIELFTEADVPGLDDAAFQEHAAAAKVNCPVSKALASVEIVLEAHLLT
jgi:lipoyl-dependent peroxiredoxin